MRRRITMFLVCTLSASNVFAGGGGDGGGFDPSGLILLVLLLLGFAAAYFLLWWLPSKIIGSCLDYRRRARTARAWIKELYRDPPPPYRGDDRPPVST